MGYHDDIARWRQVREANWEADRAKEILREHQQAEQERDQAIKEYHQAQDESSKRYWNEEAIARDNEAIQYENEYASLTPDPADVATQRYMQRRQPFIERYGQKAIQNLDHAHAYATRPRTGSRNPSQTGMGLRYGTPAYFRAMDALLETYGKDAGTPFDPKEKALTADEACKISGVNAETYNRAAKALHANGMFSYQKKEGT